MQSTQRSLLFYFHVCLPAVLAFAFLHCSAAMLPAQSDARSIAEFRSDLKSFMKLSKSDDSQLERNAIFNLCQLHCEVAFDSRFESSQQLQGIRAVIAKRLKTFSDDHRKFELRQQRLARKSKIDKDQKSKTVVNDELESEDSNAEFQFARNQGGQGSEGAAGSDALEGESTPIDSFGSSGSEDNYVDSELGRGMYDAAAESYYSMGAIAGGPNQLFGYAGRFAPPWDHGEELVDLIVNVIDPSFWRQNGGTGSIHYYRPSLVLVVHAPQQGQEATADLLNRLRAAGGGQLNMGGFAGAVGN